MNKKQIRLTESDLKQIIKESVNRVLNEKSFGIDRVHDSAERRWRTYEKLIMQIDEAAQELKKITGYQNVNVPNYKQIEEPMYNLADAVLNALDEYGYGENSLNGGGFDPTYYQDW